MFLLTTQAHVCIRWIVPGSQAYRHAMMVSKYCITIKCPESVCRRNHHDLITKTEKTYLNHIYLSYREAEMNFDGHVGN